MLSAKNLTSRAKPTGLRHSSLRASGRRSRNRTPSLRTLPGTGRRMQQGEGSRAQVYRIVHTKPVMRPYGLLIERLNPQKRRILRRIHILDLSKVFPRWTRADNVPVATAAHGNGIQGDHHLAAIQSCLYFQALDIESLRCIPLRLCFHGNSCFLWGRVFLPCSHPSIRYAGALNRFGRPLPTAPVLWRQLASGAPRGGA